MISAKMNFLKMVERKLSMTTTANTMACVLSTVSEIMDSFEMREIEVTDERDDMMESFLEAMNVQSRSQKTIAHYRFVLRQMLNELKINSRKINVYHLRSYIAKMKNRGLKDSTLNHYREVYSSYFGWLFREGLIEKNPIDNLGLIKVPKENRKIFSDVEMEKIRQGCHSLRDKAIVAFLAATGCRVGELVGLDVETMDMDNMECVVRGKGNKERTVYMDAVTSMYLRNYLEQRNDDCKALFVNRYGRRFETDGIRELLKRIEKRTGVDNVHPHRFRRTLATNMAKRGMPIQTIAALLGHEKIETTMRYISMNREDVKLKYKQYYAS